MARGQGKNHLAPPAPGRKSLKNRHQKGLFQGVLLGKNRQFIYRLYANPLIIALFNFRCDQERCNGVRQTGLNIEFSDQIRIKPTATPSRRIM
ncbi:hypothetical protein HCH_05335 [Hahella chejuensis KCTC 2396]|uniref:Uncharacterized protein n=1 Tax=Hahella chejuensis (strain KCTC 2396) TaxID=349521 RepID=Q2SBG7_HAHCH|nr:hypothetical protein HCH_05335 [Hahella chejuensis KCTC 2396]